MRKLLALVVLLMPLNLVHAEYDLNAPAPVLREYGPVEIYDPIASNPRAIYYYDFRSKQNIVGGEKILLKVYGLEFFGGLGTDVVKAHGLNPVLGGNLPLPNPLPTWLGWDKFHPSLTGGYNFQTEQAYASVKVGVEF